MFYFSVKLLLCILNDKSFHEAEEFRDRSPKVRLSDLWRGTSKERLSLESVFQP